MITVNVVGHDVTTDTITITTVDGSGTSQTSTTKGNTFILYPGDSVSISTANPSITGTARHMGIV